ncbi:hypothetical protein SCAR479_01938 [Seiridium cardinale]|uniref:NTF2-like protein n=1 Tax=Seiridium cardinale TaxID=138064 RepID=A0ABR2Y4N7_9PEZI
MALQAVYKQFLTAPDASLLANDAALHYVTTTTSYRGPAEIVKHLGTLRNQVKKKKEDFLTVIEGQNAAAIEVDTILEFATSGAAYLPGLDDNFLSDRTVYLPVTHIVTFDADGKIRQIRQNWDQAALLKQLDVIGKTGRNWPIRDAKEQIKLIESSLKASGDLTAAQDPGAAAAQGRGNSHNAARDPHAPLALFAPREEAEQQNLASVISPRGGPRPRQRDFTEILGDEPSDDPSSQQSLASVISPRGGVRPRQRDFAEILGDEPVDDPSSPSAGHYRSQSPSKAIAPKAGSGKAFQPNRLFDAGGEVIDEPASSDNGKTSNRFYRPDPKRYDHFDLADSLEPQDAPKASDPAPKKTKHANQWNFEDFNTPAKVRPGKTLQKSHQDVRHWGNEDDEVQDSPVRKPAIAKPRRDAETHFEFVDDGLPQGEPRATRPRGVNHNNGLGLYKNNVYSEGGEAEDAGAADQGALGNITNLKSRGKTFESQISMTDDSPAPKQEKPQVSHDRQKVVKMMDSNWSNFDQSPSQKENQPVKPKAGGKGGNERGIHIGGDGMGGSRGTNRDWLFGDGDDEPAKALPTRKQNAAKSGGFNWDF